jgi:hypothetical protein
LADFEAELLLACRIGILAAAGYRSSEIKKRLACGNADFEAAKSRVRRAARQLGSLRPDELG